MARIKYAYVNGMSVEEIARKTHKHRTTIYKILKQQGVNTNMGYDLRKHRSSPIGDFMDKNWTEDMGRSPKKIAEMGGFEVSSVANLLRKRRQFLAHKIERLIQLKPEYDGVYTVDPYTMSVKLFKGANRYPLIFSENDIIEFLQDDLLIDPQDQ